MFYKYRFIYSSFKTVIEKQLFSLKRYQFRSFISTAKNLNWSTKNALNVNTNVIKDVIIYKYDNPRFFKILNIFALCQFGFWAYLSVFTYTSLRDAPVPTNPDTVWWQKINLGENKYRNTIALSAFIIGYGILTISWIYTLRSVRYLVLRKGGDSVTFVTYTPFGENRMMTVGLKNVSSQETRSNSKSLLPVKIKNQFLYYLVDMKGEFKNTSLFDHTVGLKRNLK